MTEKEIRQLIDKQFLTIEQALELLNSDLIDTHINNGNSGLYDGYAWFSVFIGEEEYDIYIKPKTEV